MIDRVVGKGKGPSCRHVRKGKKTLKRAKMDCEIRRREEEEAVEK
jgi:hypothetical protein